MYMPNELAVAPRSQYNGIDIRTHQQMHFAQPNTLKFSQKPIVYYQDIQPENSLIPSQMSRSSYKQAALSEYDGNLLTNGDQSPPLSHYSGKTAKSEPAWRHNPGHNNCPVNRNLNQPDFLNHRRPSPQIPHSDLEPNLQRHTRFLSQEIYHTNQHFDHDDTISQPSSQLQPNGLSFYNQFAYQPMNQPIQQQHHTLPFQINSDAYPPYYHSKKETHSHPALQQTTSFHPNPSYSAKPPKRIHPNELQHRPLQATISSVPTLYKPLSPTEAKAQELVRILVTSQDITSLCRAATIIQQMTYGDDVVKGYFREVGAIQALISHLQSRQDSVLNSALGALRNLSYGVELNKRVIASGWGLSNLMQLLLRTQLPELREQATGVLWNVSSSEYLKKGFLDICIDDLVRSSVLPLANWDTESVPLNAMNPSFPSHVKWNAELKNSTGVLRNVTSFGKECRRRMRSCVGLVDSVLYIICSALGREDLDNQIVENCICILRNLSYRMESEVDLREGVDDRQIRWDTPEPAFNTAFVNPDSIDQPRKWYRSFCISFKKRSRRRTKSDTFKSPDRNQNHHEGNEIMNLPEKVNGNTYDHLSKGVTLLWQPEIVDMYILLLKECSNRESIEATLGSILNLTACNWKWASYIRTAMRNKKGLPLIVKVITTIDNDLIIRSASTTLRNLSYDPHNKVLIGDYAMVHLVDRLPGGKHSQGLSDACYQTLLNTINELIQNCPDNINRLIQNKNCVATIVKLAISNYQNTPKTIYLANKVCLYLHEDKAARPILKKEGWNIANWQKVVDWLEQETSSTPSDSNLSGPYNSKNLSLRNAYRQRAKSDSLAENSPLTHRTLDVGRDVTLFREASIVSGSSRTSQPANSLISQQTNSKQMRTTTLPNIEGHGRANSEAYNPHKKLQHTLSYPESQFRHPLEQVHRDSPVPYTSRSPRTTPLLPENSNLINSRDYCYVPDLSTKQKEILESKISSQVPVQKRSQATPSPNPSVTTGQEESRESLLQVADDAYSKVDVKKKRERRLTTHVRPEDLPSSFHKDSVSSDKGSQDKLPSKYTPKQAPQLVSNTPRFSNVPFDRANATDSWV